MTLTQRVVTAEVHAGEEARPRHPMSGVGPEPPELGSLLAQGYARMALFA